MSSRQKQLLRFCGFEIKDKKIIDKNNPHSLVTIYYEEITDLFTLKIKSHSFRPNDYDTMEAFGIEFGRKLGLVHELNLIRGWEYDVCS